MKPVRIFLALTLAAVACGSELPVPLAEAIRQGEVWRQEHPAPTGRFAESVQAYLRADAITPPPRGAILFIGSSIIRQWSDLRRQMAPLPVFNRAFGGSRTSDLLERCDQLVLPYAPRVIVYYAGGNDLNNDTPPAAIVANFHGFAQRVRTALPGTRLLCLSINRVPQKREKWAALDEANRLLAAYCAATPGFRFLDVNPAILDAAGEPRRELLRRDGLHFWPEAYDGFTAIVRPVLAEVWREVGDPALVMPDNVTGPVRHRVLADVEFLEPGRTEKLDLYLPYPAPRAPVPAVVWIHGGGWTDGDKARTRERRIGPILAADGYVVASINYRQGPGAWPRNLLDAKNAVRFLRANAGTYGIDPARIAVMGGSAGGHLALMVGLTAGQEAWEPVAPYPGVSSAVSAIGDFYGVTNLLTRQETDADGKPTGRLRVPKTVPEVFGSDRAVWADASPVNHVRAGVPPILVVHGKNDATVDFAQAEELVEQLRAHGVPHEFIALDDVGHTFDLQYWEGRPLPRDLSGPVLRFLDLHLRRQP